MKTRALSLLALSAVLTGFLLWMVWDHERARSNGAELVLDMEPVDPRSLFRGYYVIIRTPLHRLNLNEYDSDNGFEKGDPVFVSLSTNQDGNWTPQAISKNQPQTDGMWIQGRVKGVNKPKDETQWIRIQYNIESYFADKDSAKELEKKIEDSKMRIILSIDAKGNAVIRGLEIDGKRLIDRL